eukprot:gene31187-20112_t
MEQEEWFAGKMPRDHAVMLLSPEWVATGTFLVRQSTSQAGSYALSIKTNHGPRHCQILQ